MAGEYAYDTLIKVSWVLTIANTSAPTAAELNAGTDLSTFVAKDGINVTPSNNKVSTATITSLDDTETVGSRSWAASLHCFRRNTTDTAWNLWVYGTVGNLAIRRGTLYSTTWAAAQKAEIYPSTMFDPAPDPSAGNTAVMFVGEFAISGPVVGKATVA